MQRGESGVQGWSGVEHAMWDAIGKAADLPVARLLGGYRDRLKVYRTCVFPGKPDQSDVPYETQAEYAVRLQKAGYKAMKVRAWRPRPDGRRRNACSRPKGGRRRFRDHVRPDRGTARLGVGLRHGSPGRARDGALQRALA